MRNRSQNARAQAAAATQPTSSCSCCRLQLLTVRPPIGIKVVTTLFACTSGSRDTVLTQQAIR